MKLNYFYFNIIYFLFAAESQLGWRPHFGVLGQSVIVYYKTSSSAVRIHAT